MICGLGSVGRRHLNNLVSLGVKDVILFRTGKATLPDEELDAYPQETNLLKALEQWTPDAVVISNPTSLHMDVALPAADAGCHIFLEKPVSHSLEGLDTLIELTELYLNDNLITELKGLSSLEKLNTFQITSNQIEEIQGLENCKNLQVLNLKNNKIRQISGLYPLVKLNQLFLSGNQISVIKGLETLQELETLDLGNNEITKIKGLESLLNLKGLWLNENPIDENILNGLGGLDSGGCAIDPLKFVEYCLVNL